MFKNIRAVTVKVPALELSHIKFLSVLQMWYALSALHAFMHALLSVGILFCP